MKILKEKFKFWDDNELQKVKINANILHVIDLPLEPISVDELESLACLTEIKKKMKEKLTNIMVDADINNEWKVIVFS